MGWGLTLLLFVASIAIGELLRPRPKFDTPRASSLGEFQFPTAEAGRAIPVFWGTCHVKAPNVTWYGDLGIDPITEKVKTGMFSSKRITTGYRYSLGVQMALAFGPIDEILEVRFGDKVAAFTSTEVAPGHLRLTFDAEKLFGGEDAEGGVSGEMDLYLGTSTQTGNDYLTLVLGQNMPGYRRLCYAVSRGMYLGTSNYIKPCTFVLKRCPNQLAVTAGRHEIDGSANPVCALYEALTDQYWGVGLPESIFDQAAFRTAANLVHSEGLGVNLIQDTQVDGRTLAREILRHIDGILYQDPTTGLYRIQLARADYDPGSLPLFDPSNLLECELTRPSWEETVNVVRSNYVDRAANFTPRTVQQQDLAGIQARQGRMVIEQVDFNAFATAAAANQACAKALKTLAYPLAVGRLVANRSAWNLHEGSVLRLSWPKYGVENMVVRVNRIRRGELLDGRIELDVVEDIFAVADTAYTPPDGSSWEAPVGTPQPAAAQLLWEVPWFLAEENARQVATAVARDGGQHVGYEVWTDESGGTTYTLSNDIPVFTPTGVLADAYPIDTDAVDAVGFGLDDGIDLLRVGNATSQELAAGKNIALVGDELVLFSTVAVVDGLVEFTGVVRGVLDTVPAHHPVGTRVWILSYGLGLAREAAFAADLSLRAKVLPYSLEGDLGIAFASAMLLTTEDRASRPYPPGKVRINGARYPGEITGDLVLTWEHRNRLNQGLDVDQDDDGPEAAEDGTTYTIRVYGEDDGLIYSKAGITATTFRYPAAAELEDTGLGRASERLRVEISARRDGLDSYLAHDIEIPECTGWSMLWGDHWGGGLNDGGTVLFPPEQMYLPEARRRYHVVDGSIQRDTALLWQLNFTSYTLILTWTYTSPLMGGSVSQVLYGQLVDNATGDVVRTFGYSPRASRFPLYRDPDDDTAYYVIQYLPKPAIFADGGIVQRQVLATMANPANTVFGPQFGGDPIYAGVSPTTMVKIGSLLYVGGGIGTRIDILNASTMALVGSLAVDALGKLVRHGTNLWRVYAGKAEQLDTSTGSVLDDFTITGTIMVDAEVYGDWLYVLSQTGSTTKLNKYAIPDGTPGALDMTIPDTAAAPSYRGLTLDGDFLACGRTPPDGQQTLVLDLRNDTVVDYL